MYSVPNPKSRNYKRDKETKSQDCAFRAKFQNNISLKNFTETIAQSFEPLISF